MSYVDLDTIHNPTAGTRPPASWGAGVNDNFDFIYDEVLAKLGQWTDVPTPVLTQSVTVNKTVTYCRYNKIGRKVTYEWDLAVTSSGTANNSIFIGLPVTAASTNKFCGRFGWYNASVFHFCDAYVATTTTLTGIWDTLATGPGLTTAGRPNQLLNTHVLRGFLIYESAT